jgi:anti-sigma regulatory factor (Ser/Thr protein kinase)
MHGLPPNRSGEVSRTSTAIKPGGLKRRVRAVDQRAMETGDDPPPTAAGPAAPLAVAAPSERRTTFEFAPTESGLRECRGAIAAEVARELRRVGAASLTAELTLALDEALNNAVEHGAATVAARPDPPSPIRVVLESTPRLWRATVRDSGAGVDLLALPPPDALAATGGFGLALIRSIVSRLSSRRVAGGHELLLERALPSEPIAPPP